MHSFVYLALWHFIVCRLVWSSQSRYRTIPLRGSLVPFLCYDLSQMFSGAPTLPAPGGTMESENKGDPYAHGASVYITSSLSMAPSPLSRGLLLGSLQGSLSCREAFASPTFAAVQVQNSPSVGESVFLGVNETYVQAEFYISWEQMLVLLPLPSSLSPIFTVKASPGIHRKGRIYWGINSTEGSAILYMDKGMHLPYWSK